MFFCPAPTARDNGRGKIQAVRNESPTAEVLWGCRIQRLSQMHTRDSLSNTDMPLLLVDSRLICALKHFTEASYQQSRLLFECFCKCVVIEVSWTLDMQKMLLLCTFKFHKSIIFRHHLSFGNVNLCYVDSNLESQKRCYK